LARLTTKETDKNKGAQNKRLKGLNSYARFSAVGIQMGLIILAGTYLGVYLDEKFQFEIAVLTIVCSLASVALALYLVIREVSRKK
jgi:hypothetical protein